MDIDDDLPSARLRLDKSGARARKLRAQLADLPNDHPDRARLEGELHEVVRDFDAALVTITAHGQFREADAAQRRLGGSAPQEA